MGERKKMPEIRVNNWAVCVGVSVTKYPSSVRMKEVGVASTAVMLKVAKC